MEIIRDILLVNMFIHISNLARISMFSLFSLLLEILHQSLCSL